MKKIILIILMAFCATFANAQTDRFLKMSDTTATKKIATKSHVNTKIATKQDKLVSGTTLKTVNGVNLLGNGNVVTAIDTTALATKTLVNSKQNILVSGTTLKTVNGVDLLGAGNVVTAIDTTNLVNKQLTITINGLTQDLSVNRSYTVSANISPLQVNTTDRTVWNTGKNSVSGNTSFGESALRVNATGFFNSAYGHRALGDNTSGGYNIAIGKEALGALRTGNYNVAIGVEAGRASGNNFNSNQSIFIGANTNPLNATGRDNEIVIGYGAMGAGSNTATLGNASITLTRLRGQVLGGSFVKDGGTGAQMLMADGTVKDYLVPFNLVGGTTDAGSNKTSNIYRTGGLAVGGSTIYGNLTAIGGTSFSGVPAYGVASIGLINHTSSGWGGSGFLFTNSTVGANAFSMVYNNDRAFFGHLTSTANNIWGAWNATGLTLGNGNDSKNRIDVVGSAAIGAYATVTTAPGNGLIVSGNVGIGTATPDASAKLQVTSTTQGFLPPTMTNAERIAIASPANGLVVFVTDGANEGLWVKKSTGWVQLANL